MKIVFFLFVVLSFIARANAQIGIGTPTPATSAILDASSTSKGFIPPRMTMAQRDAIASPVQGLMIFCTNCGGGEIEIYSGIDWKNIIGVPATPVLVIGASFGGGKVAYILQPGDPGYIAGQVHGLIAAVYDQSTGVEWGCFGTNLPGADATALGTGNQNTIDITNGCGSGGIAARICNDLVLNGYSDWYLPSKDELNKLYLNKAAIGGFTNNNYWSSSEVFTTQAWNQNFLFGTQDPPFKSVLTYVRAVRSF